MTRPSGIIDAGGRKKQLPDGSAPPWSDWLEELGSAEHAIRWIEAYIILPKGHGSGARMRLARFQKRWLKKVMKPGINSAVLSLPRGNGKSTFLAALALWALFCPGPGGAPQVPIIATTIMQAQRSVYGVALAMLAAEPQLSSRALVYSGIGTMRVRVPWTLGEMFPVSSDPAGLQGLDPSLAVADEVGFLSVESWDSLLLASGKRPRSLVVGIGTPGFDKENALWHLRVRVESGEALPGFSYMEYAAPEGCDVRDEAVWRKANPALAEKFLDPKALRTAVAVSPLSHFQLFRLGMWVEGVECWLGSDGRKVWDAARAPWKLVSGAETWVGVDVGIRHDSTAVVALQRRPDGRFHAVARIWLPTKDVPVDVTDVMHHIRALDKAHRLAAVSFDPRFFDVPAKVLGDEGITMIEVPQSVERMTQACGSAYELLMGGGLTHDGDPGFDTQVLNAVARFNERGFTLAKGKSRGRIDAAVALCLAVDRALRQEPAGQVAVW